MITPKMQHPGSARGGSSRTSWRSCPTEGHEKGPPPELNHFVESGMRSSAGVIACFDINTPKAIQMLLLQPAASTVPQDKCTSRSKHVKLCKSILIRQEHEGRHKITKESNNNMTFALLVVPAFTGMMKAIMRHADLVSGRKAMPAILLCISRTVRCVANKVRDEKAEKRHSSLEPRMNTYNGARTKLQPDPVHASPIGAVRRAIQ